MHTTKYMPFIRKKAAYWKKILRNTWIRHWRLPNLSSRNINLCTANSKLQSWYVSEPVSVLCKKRIYTGKMFAQYECVILVCIKLRCMRYFVFFLTPFSQEITNYRNICSEEIKHKWKTHPSSLSTTTQNIQFHTGPYDGPSGPRGLKATPCPSMYCAALERVNVSKKFCSASSLKQWDAKQNFFLENRNFSI